MPRKSAASLNACFSAAYRRSSRYSSLTPPLAAFRRLICFICPALYGQRNTCQARILFLTWPSNVRTLYDMENKMVITDGITSGVEIREQRGLAIAALAKIEKKGDYYLVPSQTNPIATKYKVWMNPRKPVCTCTCATTKRGAANASTFMPSSTPLAVKAMRTAARPLPNQSR